MANEAPKVHVGAVARQFKVTEALAVERGATRSRGASREGTRAAEEAERAREEEESAGESIGELSYSSTLPHSDFGSLSFSSAAPSHPTATISISPSRSRSASSSPRQLVGWLSRVSSLELKNLLLPHHGPQEGQGGRQQGRRGTTEREQRQRQRRGSFRCRRQCRRRGPGEVRTPVRATMASAVRSYMFGAA